MNCSQNVDSDDRAVVEQHALIEVFAAIVTIYPVNKYKIYSFNWSVMKIDKYNFLATTLVHVLSYQTYGQY